MSNKARPFLDFYEKHSVIPTKLEITDQEGFFKQRDFLFETLGIPKHFLKGSKFLELGLRTVCPEVAPKDNKLLFQLSEDIYS
ncbi:MAG: hypothetical protein ACKODR_10310, partial [Acidimicrobiaceae bacterium]